ncbi:Zn-ribbon domain-containing OB-fold protein [Mycolicibacterium vinylchloridicum]|uniref:Zn-ribbon domain-containing OB-fold protein n=1 Tax=Mycolicibacterium vinylchloridicum TaxID=2736928 RepID=UPI002D80CACE|nr:OB-fold domain-containing protein [Mycolicibacterium vinylchloridicum]
MAPTGTLYSWTVVHRLVHPAFPPPHTTVLVALTDFPSVRLLGMLVGESPLSVDMPMRARFDRHEDTVLVNWELA